LEKGAALMVESRERSHKPSVGSMEHRKFGSTAFWNLLLAVLTVVPALTGTWAALWLGAERLYYSDDAIIDLSSNWSLIAAFFGGGMAALPALLLRRAAAGAGFRGGVAGCLCALVAFALGETLIVTIEIWGTLRVISPTLAATFAVEALLRATGLLLLLRAVALGAFVLSAFLFAQRREQN
jgi:hypothetical protein